MLRSGNYSATLPPAPLLPEVAPRRSEASKPPALLPPRRTDRLRGRPGGAFALDAPGDFAFSAKTLSARPAPRPGDLPQNGDRERALDAATLEGAAPSSCGRAADRPRRARDRICPACGLGAPSNAPPPSTPALSAAPCISSRREDVFHRSSWTSVGSGDAVRARLGNNNGFGSRLGNRLGSCRARLGNRLMVRDGRRSTVHDRRRNPKKNPVSARMENFQNSTRRGEPTAPDY